MQDAHYQAAINAGCLLWMPPLPESEYRDVMSSLLYAQLAASKKHSPFAAPGPWHEVLGGALRQFGWATLKSGYRSLVPQERFRLSQLIRPDELPATASQLLVGDQLNAYVSALAPEQAGLQILQRNIAKYVGIDAVDGDGASDGAEPVEGTELPYLCPLSAPEHSVVERAAGLAPSPEPHAAIAAHVGLVLPGRRLGLVSVYFDTRERLAANVFAQSFQGRKVIGQVLVKTFVGELSELQYAAFRARFAALLAPHWSREVLEHLPFTGGKP